jgi:hypothetical protein
MVNVIGGGGLIAVDLVRIQTMLRAAPNAVKRRQRRKHRLPNKSSSCLASLFINRATVFTQGKVRLHVCVQTVSSQALDATFAA